MTAALRNKQSLNLHGNILTGNSISDMMTEGRRGDMRECNGNKPTTEEVNTQFLHKSISKNGCWKSADRIDIGKEREGCLIEN